jgi:hypothetical protein
VAADWGSVHIQSQELMLRTSFGLAAQLLAAPGSSAALGYPFMILLDTTPAKTGRGARLSRVQVCGGLCREEREERIQFGCCIAFYHTAVGRASAPAPCVIHGGLNQALTQTAISRFRPHELSSVHAIRQVLNCLSRTQQKRAQWVGAILSLSLSLSLISSIISHIYQVTHSSTSDHIHITAHPINILATFHIAVLNVRALLRRERSSTEHQFSVGTALKGVG